MPQFTMSALLQPSLAKSSVSIVVLGHAMAVHLEVVGQPLHAVQEGEHFLTVVGCVAEFFFGFKQGVDYVFARAVKPRVLGVELVPQDEPKNHGFGVFLASPRQRSEQNLT